jgi:hypothetical protein
METTTALPMRLAWTRDAVTAVFPAHGASPGEAIKGTPGSYGDAGWTLIACNGVEDARSLMAAYPQAAMPCWARFTTEAK